MRMVAGKKFYSLVWGILVCLASFSCKGAQRNTRADRDTTILARSEQSFIINHERPFYQAELSSTGQKVSGGKKILLLLDDPKVLQNPDGVYEVYVLREAIDVKILSSTHAAFVNVLDLYALTVSAPPDYLSVDLTKKSVEWAKDGQPIFPLIATILFRGNVLPDSMESKKAGHITVKGMRIVQKK